MRFSSLNWHAGVLSLFGDDWNFQIDYIQTDTVDIYIFSTFFEASKLPVVRWSQNPRC